MLDSLPYAWRKTVFRLMVSSLNSMSVHCMYSTQMEKVYLRQQLTFARVDLKLLKTKTIFSKSFVAVSRWPFYWFQYNWVWSRNIFRKFNFRIIFNNNKPRKWRKQASFLFFILDTLVIKNSQNELDFDVHRKTTYNNMLLQVNSKILFNANCRP